MKKDNPFLHIIDGVADGIGRELGKNVKVVTVKIEFHRREESA